MEMLLKVILPVVVILVGVVILNCPIYIGIFAATVYLQLVVNHLPLSNMFTSLVESLNKENLLSVPFFVFAGGLMAATSLGERLMNVFVELLRKVRGGTPIACVFANAVFGAISGASSAAVATFGKITYEPMRKDYGEPMAMGVITSSASLSSIIPPSITMILYCVCAEQSLKDMFKCGIIPGLLIVLLVSVWIIVRSKNAVLHHAVREKGVLKTAVLKSIPVLVLPVIVLGGVYAGIATATEIGAISAIYCLIVGLCLREINWKKLKKTMIGSAKTTAQVWLLVATSSVFAQAFTVTRLPEYIGNLFQGSNKWIFLLMINILLLVMGCIFDTAAAILIFVPMLLPSALALGIHPLHLGIIFVINLSIGKFTPPFGMNIFVAAVAGGCIGFLVWNFFPAKVDRKSVV